MSILAARLANYPQNAAASLEVADHWLAILRGNTAAAQDPRIGVLHTSDQLLATTTRETLAGALVAALERLDRTEYQLVQAQRRADRYLTAYRSARQRSANDCAALVEADEERDALRAELREVNQQLDALGVELRETRNDLGHYRSWVLGEFGSDR